LGAQLRLTNGSGDDVAREHQASTLQLPILVIGLCGQTFDKSPVGSE